MKKRLVIDGKRTGDLGLLSINEIRNINLPAYKKYYMHGTSHHLAWTFMMLQVQISLSVQEWF